MLLCATMSIMTEVGLCRHFSLANPRDHRSDDLPYLLRRVADEIEQSGVATMEILDLTISSEITADGPWWSATVYWSPDDDSPRPGVSETGSRRSGGRRGAGRTGG